MSAIIVYYSLNGNSEAVANRLAKELGAATLRLKPEKPYPEKGFAKFFFGGGSAVMKEKRALKPYEFDADAYDTIVFGFPVWAGRVTPPIHTFIEEQREKLTGKRFAAFVCESGAGGEKVLESLRGELNTDAFAAEMILRDPKTKPSEENEAKIRDFCERML